MAPADGAGASRPGGQKPPLTFPQTFSGVRMKVCPLILYRPASRRTVEDDVIHAKPAMCPNIAGAVGACLRRCAQIAARHGRTALSHWACIPAPLVGAGMPHA